MKIIASLGGDYVLILAYSSALLLPLSSIDEALAKGALSLFSFSLGEENPALVRKSFYSTVTLLLCSFLLLAIPLVLFRSSLIRWILPQEISGHSFHLLQRGSIWLWVYFFLGGLTSIVGALAIAAKKTMFNLLCTIFITSSALILPYHIAFNILGWGADKVWMANWPCCILLFGALTSKIFLDMRRAPPSEGGERARAPDV